MNELPLKFDRNTDPTIVRLDTKTLEKVEKAYSEHWFAMKELMERLKKGELGEGFKETLLSLGENHLHEFLKLLGYESVLTKEKEERYQSIRQLNEQNRELRRQLGEKVSNEDVRESLKNMKEKVSLWWKENGTGFLTDESFTGYCFKCKLSGSLSCYFDDEEETRIAALQNMGLQLEIRDDSNVMLLMNDNNLKVLPAILKNRFPSVEITKINTYWGRNAPCIIRDIEIIIFNLDDI